MIEERNCITILSEMNPWIRLCVVVEPYEDFLKVKDIVSKSYDEWFNIDTDEPISDFIKRKLDEEKLSYEMFIGDFNEDEEDLNENF